MAKGRILHLVPLSVAVPLRNPHNVMMSGLKMISEVFDVCVFVLLFWTNVSPRVGIPVSRRRPASSANTLQLTRIPDRNYATGSTARSLSSSGPIISKTRRRSRTGI